MGRKSWTSCKQRKWLEDRKGEYRRAQERRELHTFYDETCASFFSTFELRISASTGNETDDFDGTGKDCSDNEDICYAPSERAAKDVSEKKTSKI